MRSRSASEAAARLDALLDAPPGRAHACAALAGVEWFAGLRVDECPRRASPPRRARGLNPTARRGAARAGSAD